MMKSPSKTIRVPKSNCPNCGHSLDSCSDVSGIASPSPGDVSVCIRCGEFLEFDDRMLMKSLPASKLLQLQLADPVAFGYLVDIRKGVLDILLEKTPEVES